jgi:hypothetical protein
VVSIRNASPYVVESTSAASSRLELYISRGNIYQNECRSKIWKYTWFVWAFYTLIDFYMHYLTCIIQIWTTFTRYGASKWVENRISVHASLGSHAIYGNEFQTSRGLGSAIQTLRNTGFKSCVNQKLVRKFMKLGMVS